MLYPPYEPCIKLTATIHSKPPLQHVACTTHLIHPAALPNAAAAATVLLPLLLLLSCRLEQQLLQWLAALDIISLTDTPDLSCLASELSSGVLLAEVAAALGAAPAAAIQERPVTAAARCSNIQAVLDALQHLPGLQCR